MIVHRSLWQSATPTPPTEGLATNTITCRLAWLQARDLDYPVVNQVAPNQNGESQQLQSDSTSTDQLPLVVGLVDTRSHRHQDTHNPHNGCPGHIADRTGQRVDVLSHSHSSYVEGCNRKDSQDAEQQKENILSGLSEVVARVLDERHACRADNASVHSESAGYEGHDEQEDELSSQTEHTLIPDHLQGLDVVLEQQLFLEHKLETVGEKRGDQQDISHHLQTLTHNIVTASLPELLLSAKAKEEAPTIKTPTNAKALPAT